jgi:hypothetical protein
MNMNPVSTTFLTPVFGECAFGNSQTAQDLRSDYYNTFFTNLTYDAAHYANFTKSYVVKPGEPNRPDPNMTLNVDVNNCQNQIPGSVISIKDNCTRTPAFQNNCETAGEVFNGGILTEYYLNKTNRQYWQDAINNDELEGAALLEATQNLRYYTIETNQSRNNAIWTYNQMGLFDSTFNSPQNIISFLENETDEVARKQLIGTLYAVGLYNLALQYLSELNGTSTENADFISYYSILINATNNGRNIYELHEEEWQLLETIAQGGNTASLSAQGIISLVQGRHFNSILERKLNEELLIKKGTPTIKDEVTDSGNNQSFKVYPNPAGNFVNVEFQSNSSLMNREIILTDAIGKILFVSPTNLARGNLTINTSNLSDGFYFISIINNGKTEIVKKLIINH